ncbi:MAG: LptE family protein [Gemmataceae bacterium]
MRRLSVAISVLFCLAGAGCTSRGHFSLLGYTTQPNYDECIKTVYVPIFENKTFRRGLEFDVTRAVIREIESKTPFKVVDDPNGADTELRGTIVNFTKNILNRNQLNEQRETETVLTVGIVWKDLRSGEILSQPRPKTMGGPAFGPLPDLAPGAGGVPNAGLQTQDTLPIPPSGPIVPKPVLVTSTGTFIPEIGQSLTTAEQMNANRLAVQIVALMEKPW